MWQDIVLTIGNVILIFALLPTLFGAEKPALSTSIIICTVIFSFAVAYGAMELWFSTVAAGVQSVLWGVIAFQTIKRDDT